MLMVRAMHRQALPTGQSLASCPAITSRSADRLLLQTWALATRCSLALCLQAAMAPT